MAHKKFVKGMKAGKKVAKVQKNVKKIVEFYYMTPENTNVKELSACLTAVPEDMVEVWTELDLMEVVMENDSLIFQNARECFVDPLDLEFIREHQFKTIYQISYDEKDTFAVRRVMEQILGAKGGMVCADTDDFEPAYTLETIDKLCDYR